ncbi:type-F conjugative transfer system pilin assembly protein TraF [Vibrio sp. S11_S32]|uniref:type-F conjugative transfer system pilin assembly protein TraF n=1 Tax=Vibrio sp. S11_S32 TaxID=2720225 RepID=UPI0016812FBE|nr:type-F conjugative transfer system pilin assembly protein TraF [Vibrio sp. S11_S32]MBD1576958.1 type-F conjugative transfer system pilin assembly protein TraF [Vibrio sp. S11_S32]
MLRTHVITWVVSSMMLTVSPFGFAGKGAGWRWYDDPTPTALPKKHPDIIRTTSHATPIPRKTLSPQEQLKKIQEQYKNARAEAVMHPTVKNAKIVMRWHQYFLNMSDKFGIAFQKALLDDPTLSYRAKYPLEAIARQSYAKTQHKTERSVINRLAKEGFGLMFVYRGNDPLSQTLTPSLVKQTEDWQLPLIGISNDGILIPSIPHNMVNDGRVNPEVLPAIYLVNPKTKEKKAIAFGFISMTELTQNLTKVATNFKEE